MAYRPLALLASTSPIALSVGLALALPASPAAAQSAYGATQLPPISVEGGASGSGDYKTDQPTIKKLTQPLVDTPQTIETVPRQLMDDQGAYTLRDALRNVPGVSISAGEFASQGDNLTIRGFSARSDLYLDGMRDFGNYYRDPFYLQDVQVLKGPASILFGRGSTGGVVEQDSKMPFLGSLTSSSLSLGTDTTRRLTGDFNRALPELGEGAALRINVMAQDGGVADRDVANNRRYGLAPSLSFGLGTPTRLYLSYLHQSENDVPDYGVPWLYQAAPGSGTAIAHPLSLDLAQSNFYGFSDKDFLRTNVDVPSVRFEHDFSDSFSLRSQARYGNYTRDFRITEPQIFTPASAAALGGTGTPLLVLPGTPLSTLNVARNELYGSSLETFLEDQTDITLKFHTGFIQHTAVTGIEVGRETSDPIRNSTFGPYSLTPLLSPNPGQPYNANTFYASKTQTTADTQAVYAVDTLTFDEHWQLMGGLRFDRFDASFKQTSFANPVTKAGAGTVSLSHLDEVLSWRGALVYKPLSFGSIYFDAGTSFNPSAEQISLSAATASLDPEKTTSFELGSKWDLLEGRLAVGGALFQSEKDNMRETDPNNPLFNILVGDAMARGGEIEMAGHLTEEWQINAGYAYTWTKVISSPGLDKGRPLANSPQHTATLWTTYQLPWKVQIGGGLDYVSSRFASTTPTTAGGVAFFKEAPGYVTFNAMAKYPVTEHVTLQLNLYNITDEKYYDQLHPAHVVPGAGPSALFTVSVAY